MQGMFFREERVRDTFEEMRLGTEGKGHRSVCSFLHEWKQAGLVMLVEPTGQNM